MLPGVQSRREIHLKIWDVLGLSPTTDVVAIKRAYANQLRTTRPEDDPDGFARLRAAYESALAQAADPAEHPEQPPVHSVLPAETVIQVPFASVPAIQLFTWPEWDTSGTPDTPDDPQPADALKADIHALQRALRPDRQVPDTQLLELLLAVLDRAKSGTVMSQSDAERDLAVILLRAVPRSDPLFADFVDWLEWRGRERELVADPLMLTVLEHHKDARLLVPLRSGQHPLADAFKRLAQSAKPLQRWWRAHVSQQARWPELQLLSLLDETGRPYLLAELKQAEVAWWRSFAAGPKLSRPLLLIGYMFVFPLSALMVLGAIAAKGSWHVLIGLLLVPLAYMGLLLTKLYFIDWPPHLVARRVAAPPLAIQVGWLPLLAALWAMTLLPGVTQLPAWGTALAGAAGCLWALYVSAPVPVLTESRAMQALAVNAALAFWGIKAAEELAVPPWSVPPAASDGAAWLMCASGLGLQALRAAWLRVAEGRRRTSRAILGACGIGVAGVLATTSSPAWQLVNVWLVVSFVTVHRAALDFRLQDIKARVIALAIAVCLAKLVLLVTQIDLSAPITRAGGLVLVGAALFNLAVTPGESAARTS